MNILISSDLGHDPDDFFAICYLIASGTNIIALDISSGDPDQIAFAQWLCHELGLDIPIGASKLDRTKNSSGGIHHQLLKKYKWDLAGKPIGLGKDVIKETLRKHPDASIFVIGPPTSVGKYLEENPQAEIQNLLMQGGFLSYKSNPYASQIVQLDKFNGKETCATFNMNGDVTGTHAILSANIAERRFVGKHICHTFIFDKQFYEKMDKPQCRAAELFMEGAKMYLEKHQSKAFHDVLAALCLNHPNQIGDWIEGMPYRSKGEWGTQVGIANSLVLANLNRDKAYEYLTQWR